jgi:membrane-associated phospholipid phosphatase
MAIDLHYMLLVAASEICRSINPIFVALVLEEPLIPAKSRSRSRRSSSSLWFYLQAVLAIGIPVALAELGKKYQVWPGHLNFPSGHTTFAAAAATCLVMRRGERWAWMAVPLVLLMALGLLYGHWHTPLEVLAALVLGPAVAWMIMSLTTRR